MKPHPERLAPLIEAALTGSVSYDILVQTANAASLTPPDMLDDLADYIASAYMAGDLDFEVSDRVMNSAYSVTVQPPFWDRHDRTIPERMRMVFEAFDAGEHFHEGDGPEVDPEVKYTRPLIAKYLAGRLASVNKGRVA